MSCSRGLTGVRMMRSESRPGVTMPKPGALVEDDAKASLGGGVDGEGKRSLGLIPPAKGLSPGRTMSSGAS